MPSRFKSQLPRLLLSDRGQVPSLLPPKSCASTSPAEATSPPILSPECSHNPTFFPYPLGRWIKWGDSGAVPEVLLKQEAIKLLSLTMEASSARGGQHDL